MIGTALDKYEVLQKLGEGGMATVYRGRHATLGRDVAIKVLHPHLSASMRNRKRFAREARAIEQLRHPHIVEIFDYSGESGHDCYIVTEFVDGITLTDLLLRTGRLPSEVVAMVGIALAEALAFAHGEGILHRDLKPDNVMLRNDGTVKLMDFGIARFLDEARVTMTGALVGSPAYMSPEQAREAPLDARSDLFSLGTLLYQLATGQLPFAGSNPSLILKNIIEGQRPAIADVAPSISATLADAIERLMQINPDHRFPSADAVAEALREVLAEVGVSPAQTGWSIADYLHEPAAFEVRLTAHLETALIERGKAWLEAGDALAALRLFNRLLSLNPDHAEVLTLIQGLHVDTPGESKSRFTATWIALPAILALGAAALAWSVRPPPAPLTAQAVAAPVPVPAPPEVPPPPPGPEPTRTTTPVPEETPEVSSASNPPRAAPRPERPALTPAPAIVATPPADRDALVTFLVDGAGWAEVYCDQRRVGRTRPPDNRVAFAPGTHRCRYTSPHILEEPFEFSVFPGEARTLTVSVRPRPLTIPIDDTCADTCAVHRDGTVLGSVASIGRVVAIDRPDEPHVVEVTCGERRWRERFDGAARPMLCAGP